MIRQTFKTESQPLDDCKDSKIIIKAEISKDLGPKLEDRIRIKEMENFRVRVMSPQPVRINRRVESTIERSKNYKLTSKDGDKSINITDYIKNRGNSRSKRRLSRVLDVKVLFKNK